MITLKIKHKGFYIEIPGLPPFRTPADVNISHISIPLAVSALKKQGITVFKIVSDTKGKEQTLTQRDFMVKNKNPKKQDANYEKRFNKLEALMTSLLNKQTSNTPSNKEQITNRLNSIEKLIKEKESKVIHVVEETTEKIKKTKKKNKAQDTFIPSINLDGMEIKGSGSQKTIKQDKSDIDDSADLLSRIMQEED